MEKMIGKKVVLTLRNFSPARSIQPAIPATFDLEGTVMRRGHWEKDPDVFGFAVPFTDVPLRQIHIRLVEAVNGVPMVQKAANTPRTFQIKASKGTEFYAVKCSGTRWSCSCVANSSFGKLCRHIKEAQEKA